jgi:hypothetical protein
MEPQPESSLFEIRVNENGKNYIRKFCRLIIPMLIFLILTMAINLFVIVKYLLLNINMGGKSSRITLITRGLPYFSILTAIINFVAVIYYVRFANSLKFSLAKNDEPMFNESFRHLSRNALFFLVTLIMTFLTWCWSLAGGWLLDNF